jgi:hypothetical protein
VLGVAERREALIIVRYRYVRSYLGQNTEARDSVLARSSAACARHNINTSGLPKRVQKWRTARQIRGCKMTDHASLLEKRKNVWANGFERACNEVIDDVEQELKRRRFLVYPSVRHSAEMV